MRSGIEGEKTRLPNWLPVFLALGIAAYFSLPFEPNVYLVTGGSLFLWLCVALSRQKKMLGASLWLMLLAFTLIASGLSLATIRTANVRAPALSYEIGPRYIEGAILSIEPVSPGQRYILGDLDLKGLKRQAIPKYIRLRSNIRQKDVDVGDRIRALVKLKPPSQPMFPAGFSFARYAYYKQIGGVGYILGKVKRIGGETEVSSEPTSLLEGDLFWNGLRNKLVQRIEAYLDGDEKNLAITFLTGQKGGISKKARNNIRKSGLAHLLAISGLHMGLVAGIIFFSLRFLMATIPKLALNYPVKKIAAFITLVTCFGYLALIGMPLSAQRAFVMAGVSLLAIIFDRQAISMRTVSVAALILLVLSPEVLVSASFQLSFAAVVALVAVFEFYDQKEPPGSVFQRMIKGGKITILCSLIASLATAPFVLYHFHSLPLYGILANLIAVPFTALVLMPLVLLSYVLMPLGLEGLSLVPLGWAFSLLLLLADGVASIPHGELKVSAFPVGYLALVSLGGLWVCLIKSRLRLMGCLPLAVFIGLLGFSDQRQDIFIDGKSGLIAIRQGDELYTNHSQKARFVSKVWQNNLAISRLRNWRDLPQEQFHCDESACLYRDQGLIISFIKREAAFREDCLKADYIITTLKIPGWCKGKRGGALAYWDLRRRGVHSISMVSSYNDPTEMSQTLQSRVLPDPLVKNVREFEGERPWGRWP